MTLLYHPRPKRWPQFTLKGLLIAMTLAGPLLARSMTEYQAWQAREAERALLMQVQLPTFTYVTVTTTICVPDGGTVLK